MDLESALRCGTNVLTVRENRIDAAIALQFKDVMRQATLVGPSRIILDLSHVEFVDSSGLGAIVGAMKQLPQGKTLELAGLTVTVAKVFELTRMDTIFSIHADLELAFEDEEV
ncbi:STAS domain-containing protein [Cognatishimia activa]|uniref:Anti-sigma factor antagonist n=1 Tax=Cognatishimia activa TaxID=1715691 RepID=A0A0P1ILG9_9RHOB|nr:STAS domain-containing protein [Cognatishimia activa]CUI56063.1 Putative anti-sigma factor antagonist [Cognatishimia activa]CUK24383.1 Putative anti-sigma factor antagonist [Cognatishimia activa]